MYDVHAHLILCFSPSAGTHATPVFLNRRARGPVPGPGINYTGPRKVLLEFLIF
jgi:hypothetical protein